MKVDLRSYRAAIVFEILVLLSSIVVLGTNTNAFE